MLSGHHLLWGDLTDYTTDVDFDKSSFISYYVIFTRQFKRPSSPLTMLTSLFYKPAHKYKIYTDTLTAPIFKAT